MGESDMYSGLPEGFVYVTDIVPDVILEIRYYGTYNFIGARIDDYLAPVAILSSKAADALKKANADLQQQGYAIKIFDAYRPSGAVSHFIRWAKDEKDIINKEYFYPHIKKSQLLTEDYISDHSGHSRGSTIDLTIIDKRTGKEVDMGSPFDFFEAVSNLVTNIITEEQKKNRLILRNAMEKAGFRAIYEEWWHFTLINEPFPDTYFDFPVK